MSNRIRYTETDQHSILKSTKSYQHPTNNLARYYIMLNIEMNAFKVMDEMTNEIVKYGEAGNLHLVKIKAKQALVDLGIDCFQKEERKKNNER